MIGKLLQPFQDSKVVLAIAFTLMTGWFMVVQFGPSKKLESLPRGMFFDSTVGFETWGGREAIKSMGDEGRKLYRLHHRLDLLVVALKFVGVSAIFLYATSKVQCDGRFRLILLSLIPWVFLELGENWFISQAFSREILGRLEPLPFHVDAIRQFAIAKMIGSAIVLPALLIASLALMSVAEFGNQNVTSEGRDLEEASDDSM